MQKPCPSIKTNEEKASTMEPARVNTGKNGSEAKLDPLPPQRNMKEQDAVGRRSNKKVGVWTRDEEGVGRGVDPGRRGARRRNKRLRGHRGENPRAEDLGDRRVVSLDRGIEDNGAAEEDGDNAANREAERNILPRFWRSMADLGV
ncbi:hypothetical protein NDU88_003977 [Pleurodeles waltl]|uniref:Uncharacterized protein n=1 Tax=Pleurodeles waltl TaxID=8319 RepID=A0AAV7T6X3_PLEWA|nr:hypothetical protein NDU88_003976 [Pleurodeles waltl]KAJ1172127.1 hypothetical protein NDU88_003977 [Pleurodeles waltl]